MKPRAVTVSPSKNGYQIVWWVRMGAEWVRKKAFRSTKDAAEALATEKRGEAAMSVDRTDGFAGELASREGKAPDDWRELLWQGSLAVAEQPANEDLQRALKSVAMAAQAARKYLPDAQAGDEDGLPDDVLVARMVAETKRLAQGLDPERRAELLKELRVVG